MCIGVSDFIVVQGFEVFEVGVGWWCVLFGRYLVFVDGVCVISLGEFGIVRWGWHVVIVWVEINCI